MKRLLISISLLSVFVLVLWAGCGVPPAAVDSDEPLELAAAMGGDTLGYARATGPRPFDFPADYGAHPEFKTEWWYLTGNLESNEGRRFGYELTLFRSAMAPPDSARDADTESDTWATNQLYMGHFSLADPETGTFHAFERFARGAAGLAGAESPPFRIWLEDWTMTGTSEEALFPLHLDAMEDGVGIDLMLSQAKPIVLQGERGWDPKGEGSGNASYYYSFTRIQTAGSVIIDGDTLSVAGTSWKDHEWSTSALGDDEMGWDWFALQLDDGREIMFYQLRRKDGTQSPFTGGTFVREDGTYRHLPPTDVTLEVRNTWTSDVSGAEYPSGWNLRIPSEDLDLVVQPVMPNQELNVSVRYWEGAVDISSTSAGVSISGRGYVELTGYEPLPVVE
ncbi:MAG: carotenoid 1,2-hydratase [Bacteroidota bacterium]|nr:carotenoid 1,2-hydratase [Bacteroidota bacterium]